MERMEPVYLLLPIAGAFLFLLLGCCFGRKMKEMLHIPKEVILGRQLIERAAGEIAQDSDSESDMDEGPSIRIIVRGGRGRTRPIDNGHPIAPMGNHMGMMAWGEDSGIGSEPSSSHAHPGSLVTPCDEIYLDSHSNKRHCRYLGSQESSPDSSPSHSPGRTLRNHTVTLGVRKSPTQDSSNCVELTPLNQHNEDIISDIDIDLNYDDYIMDDDSDEDMNNNYDDNNNERDDENNNLPSVVVHDRFNSVCECSTSSGVVTMATDESFHDNLDNSMDTELVSSPDEGFQDSPFLEPQSLNRDTNTHNMNEAEVTVEVYAEINHEGVVENEMKCSEPNAAQDNDTNMPKESAPDETDCPDDNSNNNDFPVDYSVVNETSFQNGQYSGNIDNLIPSLECQSETESCETKTENGYSENGNHNTVNENTQKEFTDSDMPSANDNEDGQCPLKTGSQNSSENGTNSSENELPDAKTYNLDVSQTTCAEGQINSDVKENKATTESCQMDTSQKE